MSNFRWSIPPIIVALVATLFFAQTSPSREKKQDVISQIEIQGNRRIPTDTIRTLISIRPGDTYHAAPLERDFNSLWTGHEDVGWFDVSMNDPLAVSSIEGIRDLDAEIEHRFNVQRLAFDQLPERLSLQQFHRDEGFPIDLINFVDSANVRMIQGRGSTRFTAETLQCLWVVGEFFGKELQGYMATEFEVFSLINDAHPTAANPAEYAVMGYSLANGLEGRGHRRKC